MSVREVALAKKGTFATVEYSKEVKTLKGCPVTITKKTIARNVRIGCEYDSLKVVKDARGVKTTKESREKSSGLNGFEWVNFPTILQNKKGDKFVPFGMTGKKKVSDYLTDRKFSVFDKENQLVVCAGENIVWLVDERTDNRFRVTEKTRRVIVIKKDGV